MGKKGSSGGGSTATVNTPQGLFSGASSETGLGQYATSLLDSLASMTNWASSVASGGQGSKIPTFASSATVSGPQVSWGGGTGGSDLWNTQFDPTTGLVTLTNPRDANQTWTLNVNSSGNNGSWGGLDPGILAKWRADYAQHQQNQSAGGGGGTSSTGTGNQFIDSAMQEINKQQQTEQQTKDLAATITSDANTLYQEATTGTGLFPSQQAAIDLAKQSAETELASTLGGMGLGASTQAAQLKGEADLTAAAAAGSLVQGNISLAQTEQKLALGAQGLQASEQQALVQEFQSLQSTFWTEAMQGYGIMGTIIDTASKSYGYSISAYQSVLQASEAQAQIQQSNIQAQMQADSQSSSDLLSSLGKLFGSSGSSGSSLLGGVGSLFGGGSAAAASAGGASIGAGEAAAAVGGTAAGGSAIGGILSALGALFCWVARECYGDDPRWLEFREWMLRAPSWLFVLYLRHGERFANWISDKPVWKWIIRQTMNLILYVDAQRRPLKKCRIS